ncbi:SHOCT domain-containing protein|uniref:SHOCT domain-containing protein n=1 Tax=Clostridioides difficile TaxID=1496 RepID=UPI003556AB05
MNICAIIAFIKISDIRKGGDVIESVYATDEIMQFELLEDGESIVSGGLGRAVVGGALFGATGAVVGGVTGKKTTRKIVNTFKIKITFNNINNPLEYINLINTRTKTNSSIYQNACNEAQEILSVLSIIVKNNDKANNEQYKTSSLIEQVKGLKELLDIGAITEEEFNIKKKELLNL